MDEQNFLGMPVTKKTGPSDTRENKSDKPTLNWLGIGKNPSPEWADQVSSP